jgi:hypothetical protein
MSGAVASTSGCAPGSSLIPTHALCRSHAWCSGRGNGGGSTDSCPRSGRSRAACRPCVCRRACLRARAHFRRGRGHGRCASPVFCVSPRCPSSPPSSSSRRTVAARLRRHVRRASPVSVRATGGCLPPPVLAQPITLSHCNNIHNPRPCCRPADPPHLFVLSYTDSFRHALAISPSASHSL